METYKFVYGKDNFNRNISKLDPNKKNIEVIEAMNKPEALDMFWEEMNHEKKSIHVFSVDLIEDAKVPGHWRTKKSTGKKYWVKPYETSVSKKAKSKGETKGEARMRLYKSKGESKGENRTSLSEGGGTGEEWWNEKWSSGYENWTHPKVAAHYGIPFDVYKHKDGRNLNHEELLKLGKKYKNKPKKPVKKIPTKSVKEKPKKEKEENWWDEKWSSGYENWTHQKVAAHYGIPFDVYKHKDGRNLNHEELLKLGKTVKKEKAFDKKYKR